MVRGPRVCIAWLIVFSTFGVTQRVSRAQWVDARKTNDYSSFSKQMQALSEALGILEKANPALDLRKALRKGDFRFVGYWGYARHLPGIPDQKMDFAEKRLKMLKGSSDVLTQDLSRRIDRVARTYMKPYNTALLKILVKQRSRKK